MVQTIKSVDGHTYTVDDDGVVTDEDGNIITPVLVPPPVIGPDVDPTKVDLGDAPTEDMGAEPIDGDEKKSAEYGSSSDE